MSVNWRWYLSVSCRSTGIIYFGELTCLFHLQSELDIEMQSIEEFECVELYSVDVGPDQMDHLASKCACLFGRLCKCDFIPLLFVLLYLSIVGLVVDGVNALLGRLVLSPGLSAKEPWCQRIQKLHLPPFPQSIEDLENRLNSWPIQSKLFFHILEFLR